MEIFDFLLYKQVAIGAGAPEPEANRLAVLGSIMPTEQRLAGVMLVQSEARSSAPVAPEPEKGPGKTLSDYFTGDGGHEAGGDAATGDPDALRSRIEALDAELRACRQARAKAEADLAAVRAEAARPLAASGAPTSSVGGPKPGDS